VGGKDKNHPRKKVTTNAPLQGILNDNGGRREGTKKRAGLVGGRKKTSEHPAVSPKNKKKNREEKKIIRK